MSICPLDKLLEYSRKMAVVSKLAEDEDEISDRQVQKGEDAEKVPS